MTTTRYRARLTAATTALTLAVAFALALTSPATASPTETRDAIAPATDGLSQPTESRLIQIAFRQELNWQFVTSNAQAVQQIMALTPLGVAYALDASPDQVVLAQLQPLDTTLTLGYVTTLAVLYIPAAGAELLQQQVLDSNSQLYNHPDYAVHSLMSYINPSIWITP